MQTFVALAGLATAALTGCSQQADTSTDDAPSPEEMIATLRAGVVRAKTTTGAGAPPVWTLQDEDTVIHLFGTVHVLRPETEWRSPEFTAAFSAADKLVLEADVVSPEGLQAASSSILQYAAFTGGEKLSDYLDDSDKATLETALETVNLSLASVELVKPWFVTMQMSNLQMTEAGFDATSGVDFVLANEATQAGKAFGFLETAESQFAIFAGDEIDEQVDGLILAAEMLHVGPEIIDVLVDEWADGDVAGIGEIAANPEANGEEVYEALFVNRNRNWVPQIIDMLDEPGTVFIAVGAGHLAGPDSVITMLRDEGLEVAGPE